MWLFSLTKMESMRRDSLEPYNLPSNSSKCFLIQGLIWFLQLQKTGPHCCFYTSVKLTWLFTGSQGQPDLQGLRCCHNTLQAHWRIHFLCHFISCCASCLPATLATQNPSLHPWVVSALETCAPLSLSKFQMQATPAPPSGVCLGILPAMLEKSLWPGQEAGKCCLGVDAKPVQRRKQGSTQPSLWIAQSRCAERRYTPRMLCLLVSARQLYFVLPSFLPFFLLFSLFFSFFFLVWFCSCCGIPVSYQQHVSWKTYSATSVFSSLDWGR